MRFFLSNILMMMIFASCRRGPEASEIVVRDAWSRPVAVSHAQHDTTAHHSGSNGVVYLEIENRGGGDRLLRAHSEVCEVTELHQTIMNDGRMMMQMAEGGLEIPSRGKVALAPRGHHIMLIDMKHALAAGDSFAVQLEFEKSGTKTVYSHVQQP